ncbi:MAG: HPr family phosphocarrier protein [Desulfatitalea sp.]|nr:HPr family phosphocarrier protein [Desulfatitalea sp.]NNK01230.1 HPr family phosphocarrier protein [Desulfatitalea sp.]
MDVKLHTDLDIVNELGLHARSAAKLAKIAQNADGNIWVQLGDTIADAKQVLDLLTLAAGPGDRVRVRIEKASDIKTLNQIAALITGGFGE